MSSHLKRGANDILNTFVPVAFGKRGGKYTCPICKNPVSFAKGEIILPYFKHTGTGGGCSFYNNEQIGNDRDGGGESACHYNAKYQLKYMLENNNLNITHKCKMCNVLNETVINNKETTVIIEYVMLYNDFNIKADVALLNNNNELLYIFEVFYTHKTNENDRPEPWFELSAEDINNMDASNRCCLLNCYREYNCGECNKLIELNKLKQTLRNKQLIEEKKQQAEIDRIARETQAEIDRIARETMIYNMYIDNIKYKHKNVISEINFKEIMKQKEIVRIAREKQEEIDRIAREKQEEIDRIAREKQEEIYRIAREEQEEFDRIDIEKNTECNCGIKKRYICGCDRPNFELVKINNQLWCKQCNCWKCRCLK
jgi:hypothetical protein